ncbi:hypothetical protein [Neptunicella sp. SCSIO 80796]|uniref:hypothetical protein n=1 Tax=Neptunicella plasticusilytica TaxID=3117012 RepID=UPI003A4E0843
MVPGASYSASGGDATSGNGDVGFSAGDNEFGGLNYKTGVSPFLLVVAAIAAILVVKNV